VFVKDGQSINVVLGHLFGIVVFEKTESSHKVMATGLHPKPKLRAVGLVMLHNGLNGLYIKVVVKGIVQGVLHRVEQTGIGHILDIVEHRQEGILTLGAGCHEQKKQKWYATIEFHGSETVLRFIGRKFNKKTKEETAPRPDYRFFFLTYSENQKVTRKKYRILL
jgi:hypothetical protein